MTIKDRLDRTEEAIKAVGAEAEGLRARADQYRRVIALIEAADRVSVDYAKASNEQYDENKWAEFGGVDPIDSALSELRKHGDV